MEITMEVITSLLLIIGIDLVLAGDNAIVIGLAAKSLPAHQQKKAILIGSIGAVVIRAVAASIVVLLIQVPWLHLVGGLLLIAISYRFLTDNENHNEIKTGKTLWAAVRTIIVADALMGLDNVLAIAGAANNHYLLIIIGLLISVPLIMLGSALFIRLMDRFSWLVFVGSGLLALTAGKMIMAEPVIESVVPEKWMAWLVEGAIVIVVLAAGWIGTYMKKRRKQNTLTVVDKNRDEAIESKAE
ncbi:MAG: TerC family protein [Tuberibacillus sp.]